MRRLTEIVMMNASKQEQRKKWAKDFEAACRPSVSPADFTAPEPEMERAVMSVDLIVTCLRRYGGADILLVQRANSPDACKWAMPGGAVNVGETIEEAASRELKEETGLILRVRPMDLVTVLHTPGRDPRGRVVSFVFNVVCPEDQRDTIRAGDDAADVKWFGPAADQPWGWMPEIINQGWKLAFDHQEVLRKFLPRA